MDSPPAPIITQIGEKTMTKKVILFIVLEIVAIALMVHSIMSVVKDEQSAVTFAVGCVFAWFVMKNWEIWKKVKQIWKK